jgi:hypothetical protein
MAWRTVKVLAALRQGESGRFVPEGDSISVSLVEVSGKRLIDVRVFGGKGYDGPTKAGFALDEQTLSALITALTAAKKVLKESKKK